MLPFEAASLKDILVTYAQNGDTVLEKTMADMTADGDTWTVTLTQEETNLFKPGYADVQLRVFTADEKSIPSRVMKLWVGAVLNDEVMT